MPVIGHSTYAVAAIGTFLEADTMESEEGATVIAAMKSTAARISYYLGYESEIAFASISAVPADCTCHTSLSKSEQPGSGYADVTMCVPEGCI